VCCGVKKYDIINIQLKDNVTTTLKSALVFDLFGKVVHSTSDLDQAINLENLASGTYILSIFDSENRSYSQKFIKE
jgi:hypothetical protein